MATLQRALVIALTFTLPGCRGLLENLPALSPGQTEVITPSGAAEIVSPTPGQTEVIQPNGAVEIIPQPDEEDCYVRARHFVGFVRMSCSAVAHETRS
jgi:hypothetical protein